MSLSAQRDDPKDEVEVIDLPNDDGDRDPRTGSGSAYGAPYSTIDYNHYLQTKDSISRISTQKLSQKLFVHRTTMDKEPLSFEIVIHTYEENREIELITEELIAQLNQDFNGRNRSELADKSIHYKSIDTAFFSFSLARIETHDPTKWIEWNAWRDQERQGEIESDGYIHIYIISTPTYIGSYAQYPGGPSLYDGIVLSTTDLKTNVITQLMGAYFGLYPLGHPQGCISDYIQDTPNHGAPLTYCLSEALQSKCDRQNIMPQNFMAYTPYDCKYMFTAGQVQRMRQVIYTDNSRNSLIFKKK